MTTTIYDILSVAGIDHLIFSNISFFEVLKLVHVNKWFLSLVKESNRVGLYFRLFMENCVNRAAGCCYSGKPKDMDFSHIIGFDIAPKLREKWPKAGIISGEELLDKIKVLPDNMGAWTMDFKKIVRDFIAYYGGCIPPWVEKFTKSPLVRRTCKNMGLLHDLSDLQLFKGGYGLSLNNDYSPELENVRQVAITYGVGSSMHAIEEFIADTNFFSKPEGGYKDIYDYYEKRGHHKTLFHSDHRHKNIILKDGQCLSIANINMDYSYFDRIGTGAVFGEMKSGTKYNSIERIAFYIDNKGYLHKTVLFKKKYTQWLIEMSKGTEEFIENFSLSTGRCWLCTKTLGKRCKTCQSLADMPMPEPTNPTKEEKTNLPTLVAGNCTINIQINTVSKKKRARPTKKL